MFRLKTANSQTTVTSNSLSHKILKIGFDAMINVVVLICGATAVLRTNQFARQQCVKSGNDSTFAIFERVYLFEFECVRKSDFYLILMIGYAMAMIAAGQSRSWYDMNQLGEGQDELQL
jgi:hypothetical protein